MRWIPAIFALLTIAACATAPRPKTTLVKLDPMEIKHVQTPSGRTVYVRDFELLYDDAMEHYAAKRYRRAVELFDIMAREFPADERLGATQFNAGLCLLALRDFQPAILRFRETIQRRIGTRDGRDAVFLMAQAHALAGEHQQAAYIYLATLSDPEVERIIGGKLGLLDRIEATARAGIALRKANKPHKADRQFRSVQRLYQEHRETRLVAESEWVARSYYERGETYRELFATIHFKLPVERMQKELEDKAQLFLKAQNQYFRCVRLHNLKWSVAAGYEIGTLYARLIDDINSAEVPPDLDEHVIAAYKDELWKHTGTLAKKAIVVYRKNIALAKRLQIGGQWVQRSQRQLDRMQELIDAQERRRRAYNEPAGAAPVDSSSKVPTDPARRRKRP